MINRTFRTVSEKEDPLSYSLVDHEYSDKGSGLGWNDLYSRNRILLVSAAGTGKSYECIRQAEKLSTDGAVAFYIDLSQLAITEDSSELLGNNETRFKNWRNSSDEQATFFLDSIDELQLTHVKLETALNRFVKWIGHQLQRVKIVVTTRPTKDNLQILESTLPYRYRDAENDFVKIATGSGSTVRKRNLTKWFAVELESLTNDDIKLLAKSEGIENLKHFMDQVSNNSVPDLLYRPLDVLDFISDWKTHKKIRSREKQIESNIDRKLASSQVDRLEPSDLSVQRARKGVQLLAFAMHMTGRFTVLVHIDGVKTSQNEEHSLDPQKILDGWSKSEIDALLQRPIFEYSSPNRVKIHHRSISEYLATKQILELRKKGMILSQLENLFFYEIEGKKSVPPVKQDMVAWLAINEPDVFALLCQNQPEILLTKGNPESFTKAQREKALQSYCDTLEGMTRTEAYFSEQLDRQFASKDLSEKIQEIWKSRPKKVEVRLTLLNLIKYAKIEECSNIAYEVLTSTRTDSFERSAALHALIAIGDQRLHDFAKSLLLSEGRQETHFSAEAIANLFPKYISIDQLCEALVWMDDNREFDRYINVIRNQINEIELPPRKLVPLRNTLIKLITKDVSWNKNSRRIVSERPHLAELLTMLCIKGLRRGLSIDWYEAAVVSVHTYESNSYNRESIDALTKRLSSLPISEYQKLRVLDFDFVWNTLKNLDQFDIVYEVFYRQETFQLDIDRDRTWIINVVANSTENLRKKQILLSGLIAATSSKKLLKDILQEVKQLVTDESALLVQIDSALNPSKTFSFESPKNEQRNWQKRRKNQKKSEARQSWKNFYNVLSGDTQKFVSSKQANYSAYNLGRVMIRFSTESHEEIPIWNRSLIEQFFDCSVADLIRTDLMRYWREHLPELPSQRSEEKRNSYPENWMIGLIGIYAEAEDEDWAEKLCYNEARLAVRYSLVALDSFPIWINDIAKHEDHLFAILDVLGGEVDFALKQPHKNSYLLQEIGYAPHEFAQLFVPSLLDWLESLETEKLVELSRGDIGNCLHRAIKIIVNHGDDQHKRSLADFTVRILNEKTKLKLEIIMLSALFQLYPCEGLTILEARLRGTKVTKRSLGVSYFAKIFGNRLNQSEFENLLQSPPVLKSLLYLSNKHVNKAIDSRPRSSYSPDLRDDAQSARSKILSWFLACKGEEAYRLKQEISDDKIFVQQREHILSKARVIRVEELNSYLTDESQVREMLNILEKEPSSNKEMLDITVHRIGLIRELLKRDLSPRELWAGGNKETILRREIARELETRANSMYTVQQESETGDGNQPDIILTSKLTGHQAVIELKKAENWTVSRLKSDISNQLVKKYLQPDNRRAGVLLLVLSEEFPSQTIKALKQENPESSKDLDQLAEVLKQEAHKVQLNHEGKLYIAIETLDLRKPS